MSSTEMFPGNAKRHDPYRTFKFQVLIEGKAVAGLKKMGTLKKTTEAVEWRTGGDPTRVSKLPGATKYEPITLEQGLTHDPVFEDWANLVNNYEGDRGMSLVGFRKEVVINVMNLQGQATISYKVHDAWVSEYQALPEFDAGTTNSVGIQIIKLEHNGWERDTDFPVPAET